jgi:hypothetical protein
MITPRQNAFYWSLWRQAKAVLMHGRETWTQDEENKRRHEMHVRAIRQDKSHYDLTNREFDKVVAALRAIINPDDLKAQLHQDNMNVTRMRWGLRKVMRELGVTESYVAGIVKRMNENGELGSNRLDMLNVGDLRKVMIALREHQRRGDGVAARNHKVYKLQPA